MLSKYNLSQKFSDANSYLICQKITQFYAKSFYFASKFLPKEKRSEIYSLYAFSRQTDNLADDFDKDSTDLKASQLNDWEKSTKKALEKGIFDNQILEAYTITAKKNGLPDSLAYDLIAGVRADLTKNRYSDFEALEKYCYLVASVPGLMLTYTLGFSSIKAIDHAVAMGKAMQITNILRDIKEDFQEKNRIYLPQKDLQAYQISEQDLLNSDPEKKLKPLLKDYIQKARELYKFAFEGLKYLKKGRFGAKTAGVVYSKILDEIENQNYDVFNKRASVSQVKKIFVTLRSLL